MEETNKIFYCFTKDLLLAIFRHLYPDLYLSDEKMNEILEKLESFILSYLIFLPEESNIERCFKRNVINDICLICYLETFKEEYIKYMEESACMMRIALDDLQKVKYSHTSKKSWFQSILSYLK